MIASYETLVGYELQKVPKLNSQSKEPCFHSKLMSFDEQFYTKNDRVIVFSFLP